MSSCVQILFLQKINKKKTICQWFHFLSIKKEKKNIFKKKNTFKISKWFVLVLSLLSRRNRVQTATATVGVYNAYSRTDPSRCVVYRLMFACVWITYSDVSHINRPTKSVWRLGQPKAKRVYSSQTSSVFIENNRFYNSFFTLVRGWKSFSRSRRPITNRIHLLN